MAADLYPPAGVRPLAGVTVVSLEQAVAAPFASRQLADLGARVIKVERPGGGDFARRYDTTVHGQSSYFVWLNRSKESLALDIRSSEGREVLDRLLASADVLIQNLAPGAVERLGLDAGTLAERFPGLIHCSISGYGSGSSWSDRKAYDLLVQAESGLVSITGTPDDMARVGISVADISAGMYAYSGILTALLHRAQTGVATPVEVSLFDSLAEWMGNPAYYAQYGGSSPLRAGAEHATIAPYGPFPTATGESVMIAVQNEREWVALCTRVVGDPDLATDDRFRTNPLRVSNREALNEVIGRATAGLDPTEAVRRLDAAGIANARVNTLADFLDHPVLAERGRWVEVATPGGPIRALKPPAILDGLEPRMDPVPGPGEHTAAILTELGFDRAMVERLIDHDKDNYTTT